MPLASQCLETELSCGRLRYRFWNATAAAPARGDVVLLHGLLGSSEHWEAEARLLTAAGYACWALDLPGISYSDRPRDLSLQGLTAWLEQACQALGLRQFALVGSSWGGLLALDFASRSSLASRLRRLALVAPAHPLWTPSRSQRLMLTPVAARCGAWLGAHASASVHRALLERLYGDPARLPPGSVAAYGALLRRRGLGAAVASCARRFHAQRQALLAALPALHVPTLLVWGDRDPVVPLTSAAALSAALPQAQLEILPGLGHLPFMEDASAFHALLAPFLA